MGGRKRTATEVAEARGTLNRNKHRRDDSKAPRANGQQPEMPDYFDDYAKEKWKELCKDLLSMGIQSSENRELMIAYCEAYSGWRKALALVRRVGVALVEPDADGTFKIKRNPVSTELHKYRVQMNKLLPEFGLTPSSRTKLVSFKDSAQDDPFAALLARMSGNN